MGPSGFWGHFAYIFSFNQKLHVWGTLSLNFGALLQKLAELWRFVCVASTYNSRNSFLWITRFLWQKSKKSMNKMFVNWFYIWVPSFKSIGPIIKILASPIPHSKPFSMNNSFSMAKTERSPQAKCVCCSILHLDTKFQVNRCEIPWCHNNSNDVTA